MKKITLITNFPFPYRVPLINEVAKRIGAGFEAVYTDPLVPGHDWGTGGLDHPHTFLGTEEISSRSFGIALLLVKHLRRTRPETVIIYGATLPMLAAFAWAVVTRQRRIYFTDSWGYSYSRLSPFRKMLRFFIFRGFHRYIVIGTNGRQHLIDHGIDPKNIELVRIPLPACSEGSSPEKTYDFIFAGRFIAAKMPLFFLEIVRELSKDLPIKAVMAGLGPLESEIKDYIDKHHLSVDLPGYISREELMKLYTSSKILLFQTEDDVWGMSAQEALNCGTPVVATPFCGIINDLLIDGRNGFILPPDPNLWIEKIKLLLASPDLYNSFSQNARASQSSFSLTSESAKFANFISEIQK